MPGIIRVLKALVVREILFAGIESSASSRARSKPEEYHDDISRGVGAEAQVTHHLIE